MESKRIVYIGNYDHYDTKKDLLTQPSANTKILYLIECLCEAGYYVDFYSTSICRGREILRHQRHEYGNFAINYFFSVGHISKVRNIISLFLVYFQLVIKLFFLSRETSLLVYHSPYLSKLISIICWLINREKVYFEVEEIYSVVRKKADNHILKEIAILQKADGFILVNDILAHRCGFSRKHVVCYGVYNFASLTPKFIRNECVEIIYAGGLDNDVKLAIDTIDHLPNRFHLNILGYGSDKQLKELENRVKETNLIAGYSKVTYHGCLHGAAYDNFLEKCDIGLNSRIVNSYESEYAFPSKIMAYLSHNLLVVSTPHNAIKQSTVSRHVCFSEESTSSSLASTILKSINIKSIDNELLFEKLHSNMINNVKTLFDC